MGSKDLDVMLGDPKKAILTMVVPLLIAMAVVQINQFVDTFWTSGLGSVSSSAVATISPIYGIIMCAGLGIGMAATVTISNNLGRGNIPDADKMASCSVTLSIIVSILMSLILIILINPIINMMGAQEIRSECISYISSIIALSPILVMVSVFGGMFRGEGAAKKSTTLQMTAAIFNMIIDPLLIYGLNLNVFGAGLSTVLSAFISMLIGIWWYTHNSTVVSIKLKYMRLNKAVMQEVLGIAAPKTMESLISNITDIVQRVFLIIAGGTTATMLYNYPWRYIGLVNLPSGAMNNAMIPVSSSALGQSNIVRAGVAFKYTTKIVISISVVAAILLFVFAEPLMMLLTYEPSMEALRPQFVWTLRVAAFLVPFSAMMGLGSSMLQAMKKSKKSMYFYLLWGFIKLASYAVACQYSFEAIIFCMVAVHWFGGISLITMAKHEYDKIRTTQCASTLSG